jgi:type IV pilus assembly protein PilN
MIRVNLLPVKELKAEVSRRRDLTLAGVALAVTALVLAGAYFYQSYRMSSLNAELTGLRQEVEALNVKVKQVGELESRIKEFKGKHTVIEDLNTKKVGPVRVMESLSVATPTSLWLTEFKESGGNLVINGLAIDNQTIADFIRALEKVENFKNVELVETTQGAQATAGFKRFAIRMGVSFQSAAPAAGAKKEGNAVTKEGKKG